MILQMKKRYFLGHRRKAGVPKRKTIHFKEREDAQPACTVRQVRSDLLSTKFSRLTCRHCIAYLKLLAADYQLFKEGVEFPTPKQLAVRKKKITLKWLIRNQRAIKNFLKVS